MAVGGVEALSIVRHIENNVRVFSERLECSGRGLNDQFNENANNLLSIPVQSCFQFTFSFVPAIRKEAKEPGVLVLRRQPLLPETPLSAEAILEAGAIYLAEDTEVGCRS